jgi:hypothetical protein
VLLLSTGVEAVPTLQPTQQPTLPLTHAPTPNNDQPLPVAAMMGGLAFFFLTVLALHHWHRKHAKPQDRLIVSSCNAPACRHTGFQSHALANFAQHPLRAKTFIFFKTIDHVLTLCPQQKGPR